MKNLLFRAAFRLMPALKEMPPRQQVVGVGNVLVFLYTLPLAISALVWLSWQTDWGAVWANRAGFLLLAALMFLFSRLNFYTIVEIHPGTFANSDSSLSGVILWAGVFLFGPEVLWLPVVGKLGEFLWKFSRSRSTTSRWVYLRIFSLYLAAVVLTTQVSLLLYNRLGGEIPLPQLYPGDILPAMGAILLHGLLFLLVYSGFIGYVAWAQGEINAPESRRRVLFFFSLALGAPFLAYPFGILAAGMYIQNGLFSFLIFMTGLGLVAYLSRQLSRAAESSRRQFRQIVELEQLSREIINSTPDMAKLPEMLARHVPTMFPSARVLIWVEDFLLRHPGDWFPGIDRFWEWVQESRVIRAFPSGEELPWRNGEKAQSPLVTAPIFETETERVIGFIYLELQPLVQPWDPSTMRGLFPGVNALAAQIASAIRQEAVYRETLELYRTTQELEFASQIQASFFPDKIPVIPGWELAVTILPAREMAGDFFDILPLEDGRLGILIADVTDKGVGPALYMALSRTLLRTYALEYEFEPDTILFAANRRILQDARARLFVTVFLGILDTETGVLSYSNAGHNPPYLLRAAGGDIEPLQLTGIPMGIEEATIWEMREVQMLPGDALLMYTDGIPDAVNDEGELFEDDQLVETARCHLEEPAHELQASIIDEVQKFVGEAEQADDITLMVLKRDLNGSA